MSPPNLADRSTLTPPAGACPGCGTALPPDAPAGLCPRCLLSGGLFSALSGGGGRRFVAPGLEELADHFPDLDLRGVLGRGGMGAVYEARQVKLDRTVALKVLPPEVGRDPAFAERFLREARTLARLNHPHIVQVYDFGQTGAVVIDGEERPGLFYFLMEYVDGANLRDAMAAGLKPGQALEVVRQICEALRFAHDRGIVHRDVKPENVLLTRGGTVKIADFGLAKLGRPVDANEEESPKPWTLTGTRQAMGTPHYMAPEQLRGTRDVDHRADIYSLGVVFYELLTGELPVGRFAPPSSREGVDARLDEVVLKALASEPAERYQSVSDVRDAVDSLGLPSDPATPQVGDLANEAPISRDQRERVVVAGDENAFPLVAANATPAVASNSGNVRVTVGGADSRASLEERVYDDFRRTAERRSGTALDWPAWRRAAALSPERRAALGVATILCGLAAVGCASVAALGVFFHRYESHREGIVGGGLFFTALATGLAVPFAASVAWLNRGMTGGRWAGLGATGGAFARTALLSVGAAVGAGGLTYAATGAVGPPFVAGVPAALAVAVRRVQGAGEPPVWWPATWGWKGAPPREAAAPVTPRSGRASTLRGEERPAPAAHSPEARRAAEVKRNLRFAGSLLTGLAGTVAALGAALIAAGAFVADWSDDPLGIGTVLLLGGGGLRGLAGAIFASAPQPGRPGSADASAKLVDWWDCLVTLLWTAVAAAGASLVTAAVFVDSREDGDNAKVVLLGALAGLLAAGFVTLRRPTPPLWWPVGWTWKARGGGAFAVLAPVAGWVGRLAIFRTPPGGLSRPAVWGTAWLMAVPVGTLLSVPVFGTLWLPFGSLLLTALPAVPLLGWAGVRQVRTSRMRNDPDPIWGRRLGVTCAWIFPAALTVLICAAIGTFAAWVGPMGMKYSIRGGRDDVILTVGMAAGAVAGLIPAALLWFKLSRASLGPLGPAPRTTVPPGPRDTGAGLSRVFAPRSRRDWTETIAATCAALVVLAAAGWWFFGTRPVPPREAGPPVERTFDTMEADSGDVRVDAPAPPDEAAAFQNGTAPAFTVTAGPLGTGEVRWAPGVERFLGRSEGADAAAVLAAAAEVRRAWADAVAAGTTAELDDRGRTVIILPDLTAEAAAWEADFYDAADAALPDRSLQRTLRRANPLFFGSMRVTDRGEWVPAPVPLCPAGVGPIPTATPRHLEVERRGAWTRVRAWPYSDREERKANTGTGEPLFDTGETDEVPGPLRFLIPAADRVRNGQPPFPPVGEEHP